MEMIITQNKLNFNNNRVKDLREQAKFLISNVYRDAIASNYGVFAFAKARGKKGSKGAMEQQFHHITNFDKAIDKLVLDDCDTYFSVNTFRKFRRMSQFLHRINAVFVDCDFANLQHLPLKEKISLAQKISRKEIGVLPSIIVSSGHGLHLYFLFTSAPKYTAKPRWDLVQSEFCRRFQEIGSDPNAKDAARIMRIPGTINFRGDKVEHCYICDINWNDAVTQDQVKRYSFDELADSVLPYTREELQNIRAEKKAKRQQWEQQRQQNAEKQAKSAENNNNETGANQRKYKTNQKYTANKTQRLNLRRYRFLLDLLEHRIAENGGKLPVGLRNVHLFLIMNYGSLAGIYNSKNFYQESAKIAYRMDRSWKYLKDGNISTVFNLLKKHEQGETKEGKGGKSYPLLYVYKDESLIERLKISDEELDKFDFYGKKYKIKTNGKKYQKKSANLADSSIYEGEVVTVTTISSNGKVSRKTRTLTEEEIKAKKEKRREQTRAASERQRRKKGQSLRVDLQQERNKKIELVHYLKYKLGKTVNEIVEDTGISRRSVLYYLKEKLATDLAENSVENVSAKSTEIVATSPVQSEISKKRTINIGLSVSVPVEVFADPKNLEICESADHRKKFFVQSSGHSHHTYTGKQVFERNRLRENFVNEITSLFVSPNLFKIYPVGLIKNLFRPVLMEDYLIPYDPDPFYEKKRISRYKLKLETLNKEVRKAQRLAKKLEKERLAEHKKFMSFAKKLKREYLKQVRKSSLEKKKNKF